MRHGKWPGTWRAICDVCGFEFPSDEVKDRWDGLKVCGKDWESKHPQLFIRAPKETVAPPWTRPEPPDVFIPICTVVTKQAIPGWGQPGCMIPSYDITLPNQSV